MNSRDELRWLAMSVIVALFISLSGVDVSAAAPQVPDFAFPQTVAENAADEIHTGTRSGRWLDVVDGVLKLTIADNMVDSERADACAQRIDSLAGIAPAPYKQMLYSIEAQLYSEIYSSNRRRADTIILPEGECPDNTAEWSVGLFRDKISQLVAKSLTDKNILESTPLADISNLLTAPESDNDRIISNEIFKTVYDFLAWRGVDLLRASGDKESANALINSLIEEYANSPWQLAYAYLQPTQDNNYYNYFISKYKELERYPASMMLLEKAYNSSDFNGVAVPVIETENVDGNQSECIKKEMYTLCCDAIKRFPNNTYRNNILNIIDNLEQKDIRLYYRSQYVSDVNPVIQFQSTNVNEAYLYIYKTGNKRYQSEKEAKAASKQVGIVKVDVAGNVPFTAQKQVELPQLGYGSYFIIPYADAEGKKCIGNPEFRYVDRFIVSDLSMITATSTADAAQNRLYVVDARNGKPRAGVTVKLSSNPNGKTQKTLTTNKEGYVSCGKGDYSVTLTSGDDCNITNFYASEYSQRNRDYISSQVMTDLSIYHPGDSIGFAVVVYKYEDHNVRILPDKKLKIRLTDVNMEEVSTLDLTTDAMGRCSGRFVAPSGLLGSAQISVNCDGSNIGYTTVQVADYKAPAFVVEMKQTACYNPDCEDLHFSGIATTYSGVPIGDAKVEYTVSYNSWWLWRQPGTSDSFGGEAITDSAGRFEVAVPINRIREISSIENGCCRGAFSMVASVTSPAGESVSSQPIGFTLGSAYRIQTSLPDIVEVTGTDVDFKVNVIDIAGQPVNEKVAYSIINATTGKEVLSGEFTSPDLCIPASKIPSAKYNIKYVLVSDSTVNASIETVLWRNSDKVAPYPVVVWSPRSSIIAKPNERSVDVIVGSGYADSWILVEVVDTKGFKTRQWVHEDKDNKKVFVAVPADNDRVWVSLTGIHNCEAMTRRVQVLPASSAVTMTVKAESFRDRISPMSQERWSFRFALDGKDVQTAAMAVISDKALNAISPFRWTFAPRDRIYFTTPTNITAQGCYSQFAGFTSRIDTNRKVVSLMAPEWNLYGYRLSGLPYYGMMKFANVRMSYAQGASKELSGMVSANTTEMVADMASVDEVEEETKIEGDVDLKPSECPLAYFNPSLVSARDGLVEVSFTVPNFDTTWQFQLTGYDADLHSAVYTADAMSARPVMVNANAPRFLRVGDSATLLATLYNNTDSEISIVGRIEIVDPATGRVIMSEDCPAQYVNASGYRVISLDVTAPEMDAIILRVYASTDEYRDGEQTIIPILAATTPVIESIPIYMARNQKELSLQLPQFKKDGRVDLTYCANPIWLCITALPQISTAKCASILTHADALFADATALWLTHKYPEIQRAVDYWSEQARQGNDSTLYSNLVKDEDLKLKSIKYTPWVQDAASQTLKMMGLKEYLLNSATEANVSNEIKEISRLQNSDGGWSWCPGMGSSVYITTRVIMRIGEILNLGVLAPDVSTETMISKAMRYCEMHYCEMYDKSKENFPLTSLTEYLYATSLVKVPSTVSKFHPIRTKALKAISADWRNMDVYDIATAAMLLANEGSKTTAKLMLESLRQRAAITPTGGMYYPNASWMQGSPISAVSRTLQAFIAVDPKSECVDGFRQWLVMQKQTMEWDDVASTSSAISSLLSTGTDWISENDLPRITIGGKDVDLPQCDKYTGDFRISLDAEQFRGEKLTITRNSASPAWGGVIMQYISPITDVKAAVTEDIAVKKSLYVITGDSEGVKAADISQLKVGDKVRVSIVLKVSRDVDYIVIADDRAACLEPDNQLSGYVADGGIWLYREIADSATNFYINRLSRGTYTITYDCHVVQSGEFASGIASAQSLYAPVLVSHSAGRMLQSER